MRSTLNVCLLLSLIPSAFAQPSQAVYAATGDTTGAIQSEVDRFRRDLGTLNPNETSQFPAGRREINWDGVGGTQGNDNLPQDFFHQTSPRGLILSTPGTRLKVSGDRDTASFAMRDLSMVDWVEDVVAFSGDKFFAPIGSTITVVEFRLPGTQEIACVPAFGAVFVDADRTGSSMEVTLADGTKREFPVPVQPFPNRGFSFIGVRFTSGCIASVRLVNGDTPVDAKEVSHPKPDRVGIDDFIYGEPVSLTRWR